MSEWLGKPKLKREDLPTAFKKLPSYSKYYAESQMARVCIIIPHQILDEFQKAVTKRYGRCSAGNTRRAAEEALRMWIKASKK